MSKIMKWILGVIAFIVIIALVCMIPPVAAAVGGVIGWTGEKLKSVAGTVVAIGVSVLLMTLGVMALAASPIIGAALLIVGIGLLAYSVWPLFSSSGSSPSLNKI